MMTYFVETYKGYSIYRDDPELFPFFIPLFVCLSRINPSFRCRFKTLRAAKSAITRVENNDKFKSYVSGKD